jgi:hypothetical protein
MRVARKVLRPAFLAAVASLLGHVSNGDALTCAPHPDNVAELVIRSGYPEDAPHEDVVIATIEDIRPEGGDAFTFGETLIVRIDAVLRGGLPLTTREIYNPPLGVSGWPGFTQGGQFLIAAGPAVWEGIGDVVSTSLCAPNEQITSRDRFDQLVFMSTNPILPATSLPAPTSSFAAVGVGLGLVLVGIALAVRRTITR